MGVKRDAFDSILAQAVHSSYAPKIYESRQQWQKAVKRSKVRLQWDPDHSPKGGKLKHRAIQLGLRGDIVAQYAQEWILEIEDISDFVAQQRQHVLNENYTALQTPTENVYSVTDPETAHKLGLNSYSK